MSKVKKFSFFVSRELPRSRVHTDGWGVPKTWATCYATKLVHQANNLVARLEHMWLVSDCARVSRIHTSAMLRADRRNKRRRDMLALEIRGRLRKVIGSEDTCETAQEGV